MLTPDGREFEPDNQDQAVLAETAYDLMRQENGLLALYNLRDACQDLGKIREEFIWQPQSSKARGLNRVRSHTSYVDYL